MRSNLERQFQSYLNYQKDNFELLTHVLERMVGDETWYRGSQDSSDQIEINFDEFKGKASELNIHNLTEYLKSDRFKGEGFTWNETSKRIVKSFA